MTQPGIDTTPLIILSNRRATYLADCLASFEAHTTKTWAPDVHIVDDSGDPEWRAALVAKHADHVTIHAVDDRPAGYTAAMRKVWDVARALDSRVFLLEEDFVFVQDFDIAHLHQILDANKRLAQVSLLREPWYPVEKRKGVMDAQQQRVDADRATVGAPHTTWVWHDHPHRFRSHDAGFTCNPSLINKAVFDHDWPTGRWTETAMGNTLTEQGFRYAWMPQAGTKHHAITRHMGEHRADTSGGY